MPDDTTQNAIVDTQATQSPPAGATDANATQAVAGTFTQEQLNKVAGAARDEGRKSAEHGLLEKFGVKSVEEVSIILEQYRKSEADKLSETDKVKKELAETLAKREALEKENQALKLKMTFDETTKELNLKFVNMVAAADAFLLLDHAVIADETRGMKAAVKQLFDERPYLFEQADVPELDATKKSKKSTAELTDDQKEEIRKRYRI